MLSIKNNNIHNLLKNFASSNLNEEIFQEYIDSKEITK